MNRQIAHPQLKYSFMNGLYWISVCAVAGFASAFLLPKGYSNSVIGITLAASNILIMLLQPVIASIIDRYKRITFSSVIILFTLLSALFCGMLLLLPTAGFLMAFVFMLAIEFINLQQPFVNALSVELEDLGCKMNFGLCRAFGSFGYAVSSIIMGFLIVRYSEQAIPVTGIICCMLFIFSTLLLRIPRSTTPADTPHPGTTAETEPETAPQSLLRFLFSNKRFLLFLLSTAFLFTSHYFTTGYLYQIACNVGGDSSSLGIAGFICAMLELPGMMLFSYFLTKVSCRTLLRLSGIAFIFRFLGFFLANSVTGLYLAQIPQSFSYAIFIPAAVHYVSRLFSKADMAKAQSLVTTSFTIGGIISSVVGGILIDGIGIHNSLLCVVILGAVGGILLFFSVEDVHEPDRL